MPISNTSNSFEFAAAYYQQAQPLGASSQTSGAARSATEQTTATGSAAGTKSSSTSTTLIGEDTVHLSATAQAAELHRQGVSISQIAYRLDVSSQVVNGYLSIPASKSETSSAAVGVPAAQSGQSQQSLATQGTSAQNANSQDNADKISLLPHSQYQTIFYPSAQQQNANYQSNAAAGATYTPAYTSNRAAIHIAA